MKRKLTEANQYWIDWRFQIHWNKHEWVNPRRRDERKNLFYVSSKKDYFEDKVKTAHWFVHLQLRSLDTDNFFKIIPGVDEKQASSTGNTNNSQFPVGGTIQIY